MSEFACAFTVSLRSSAVRENTQTFVLLLLISGSRQSCSAVTLREPAGACYVTPLEQGEPVPLKGRLMREGGDEGPQGIPLWTQVCDTRGGECFCLDALIQSSISDRHAVIYKIH